MISKDLLIEEANKIKKDIIKYRRIFHQYPETGFKEFKTAEKIAQLLSNFGLKVHSNIGGTGVIGILEGAEGNKTIALRADMDALDITEKNDTQYSSKIEGKMHACGHDGHIAMLLGCAQILSKYSDKIMGNVKFIFQPAEEGPLPGGAIRLVEENVLDDVDRIFGMHLNPAFPVGQVGINRDRAMASTDILNIKLIGKGGHGGLPHETIDPIAMTGQVLTALQYMQSREIDPLESKVLSLGTINGGAQWNAIASEVTLTGTIRTYSLGTRKALIKKIDGILKSISHMCGGDYELNIDQGYPPTINNEEMSMFVEEICSEILGKDNVIVLKNPSMGGEDFAYYLQEKPGAFFWLGCGSDKYNYPLHHEQFDMDEDALVIGSIIHSSLAIEYLGTID